MPKYREARKTRKIRNLRETLIKKQNNRCADCGESFGKSKHDKPTLDHIIPVSRGGLTTRKNVRVVHESCNQYKGAALPGEESLPSIVVQVQLMLDKGEYPRDEMVVGLRNRGYRIHFDRKTWGKVVPL